MRYVFAPAVGFQIGASHHGHFSVPFGQVIQYWIDHHTAKLAEASEHLKTDLNCDVSACELERGPAADIIPDRLRWPEHLIDKLWPVDTDTILCRHDRAGPDDKFCVNPIRMSAVSDGFSSLRVRP